MFAAFVHEAIKYRHDITSGSVGLISIGFLAAFVSAFLIVKPFLNYVSTHGFQPFAYYRIALGAFVLVLVLF